MSTLDIEAVLAKHAYSQSTNRCRCGEKPPRGQAWFDHRAHVAAKVREAVADWLEARIETCDPASMAGYGDAAWVLRGGNEPESTVSEVRRG